MDDLYLVILASGVFGVCGYFFLWHLPRKRKRREALAQQAARLGFTSAEETDFSPREKFGPLRLFCLKPQGDAENVLRGTNPRMYVFDYRYTIRHHESVGQTVAAFETNRLKWPQVVIESRKRERFTVAFMRKLTQKVANWRLKCREVDLSFHEGFSKKYRAFTDADPEQLTGLLPDSLLETLSRKPGWNLETLDRWVLIYRQGKYVKPNEFSPFVEETRDMFKALAG